MVMIKSAAEIAEKYARVTPGRSTDYAAGVATPKKSWSAGAKAAEGAYEQGVQAAIANKSFGKGVTKAGDEKWQRKAKEVGSARFGPGVSAATDDYMKGIEPYVSVLSSLTLPPRGAKGDPRNIERVALIARTLHAKKMSG